MRKLSKRFAGLDDLFKPTPAEFSMIKTKNLKYFDRLDHRVENGVTDDQLLSSGAVESPICRLCGKPVTPAETYDGWCLECAKKVIEQPHE